jgi:hypothetical protein
LFYLGTGMNERVLGHYETAKIYFEDGLVIFKKLRNWNFELIMRSELGHVARQTGKLVEAKKIYESTLKGWQDLGNRGAIANQLECFAFLAIKEEDPRRAARLLGAGESIREKAQAPMTDSEQIEYAAFISQLQSMLPEEEFHSYWDAGRSMTTEQAIQFALE